MTQDLIVESNNVGLRKTVEFDRGLGILTSRNQKCYTLDSSI